MSPPLPGEDVASACHLWGKYMNEHKWALSPISVISNIGLSLISDIGINLYPISDINICKSSWRSSKMLDT